MATFEQSSYLNQLFSQIDCDDSGRLEYGEILKLFGNDNLTQSDQSKIIQLLDSNGDHYIDLHEFQHLFNKLKCKSISDLIQKSRLYVIFQSIDADNGGKLEFEEVRQLFINEQVHINDETLKRMISSIDKNNDETIDFAEFAAAFDSVQSIDELVKQWSSLSGVDVGTDLSFSSGLSQNNDSSNTNFPFLPFVAGGVAGICSRTATAPLERIKILAQLGTSRGYILSTFRTIIQTEGFFKVLMFLLS